MGVVYKAMDTHLDRLVAVKVQRRRGQNYVQEASSIPQPGKDRKAFYRIRRRTNFRLE
jgi:hypothetical protein